MEEREEIFKKLSLLVNMIHGTEQALETFLEVIINQEKIHYPKCVVKEGVIPHHQDNKFYCPFTEGGSRENCLFCSSKEQRKIGMYSAVEGPSEHLYFRCLSQIPELN